jgi:alkylhydroperoxidase family enzyme
VTSAHPLIAPLGDEEAESAARLAGVAGGFVSMNLFRTSLRQPGVAQIWATIVNKLVVNGTLDARLRELIILRVAWVSHGSYEWANHYAYAIKIGMNDAEILAVRNWQDDGPALSAADRRVLKTVDSILAFRPPSTGEVAELKSIVGGDGPLMELLILPGIYRTVSMFTDTLAIPLDEGKAFWPPDGTGPLIDRPHQALESSRRPSARSSARPS